MERGDLGIEAEVVRQALSVSVEAHTNPEKLPFVAREIEDSPSQVIVAFPGSWSPDDWFAGDGEAKPFGETEIDGKMFPSLRRLGTDARAVVNGAFAARFLRILEDGNPPFCEEVAKAVADDKQIIFSGHSSGGPIAIYATVWFLEKYIRSNEKQTSRPRAPLCLTFGSPLTTDHIFCHAVQREGWYDCFVHFVTKLDIIPRILLAPRSSAMELLREIPPFFDPHYKDDEAKLASLFANVMKSASCVASHAAFELTGSKHTLFDTMSRFIKRSPYQPCGKYAFCTETGRLVVVKNPDAVLQLLFYSLRIKSEPETQDKAVASFKAHWTYEDALDRSLATHNVVCLDKLRELPLSSDDPVDINVKTIDAALNDLNLCVSARLCLRAAGELEKKKLNNLARINGKKGDIEKALESLEKYRTLSKDGDVGYYDAFKLHEKEEDFEANVKRLELAAIWDDIVEMLRHGQLPDGFEADKKWVDLGTRFRRLVEPIDIANYYRHSRNDMAGHYMRRGSRPSRYKYTQRWQEHAEQLPRDSCGESCFWAEVEDLKVEVAKTPWGAEIETKVSSLESRLEDWYKDKEDKSDMFLRRSTLVEWWQTLPEDHKLKSRIKGLMPLQMEMEVDDESMEEMKDAAGQRPEDMETSDRNYAIAAVQNIVGIDGRAKQITDLLEMEVNDEVRILGIYGAEGIGKTTLAKAVYDRISCCFDGRSFLAEVNETAQDHRGIQILQTRLVRDILERDREDPSFHERIEDFLDIFCERKVLIVVDDVEEKSHLRDIVGGKLDRFGPGSRIIVTSQDERILERCEAVNSQNERILEGYEAEKVRTYRVDKLDDGQAFELFCKHAFGTESSRPDYYGLANRIVNAMEKLPLAVEVVGSFLRGKSKQEWEKMESMKESMRSSEKTTVCFAKILNYCYEALDPEQKDIFLDIACFISGVDARIASCMWPSSYRPSSGCILMPLAKIGENNELQMHRLPRCLGRRILNQEERSRRFCTQDMVLKATNRETGTGDVDFTAGAFEIMPNVRFLKLDNAKLSGDFEGAFPILRGLCWQRCPPEYDAENLVLGELADLNLSWSKITEDWGGWKKIKMEKLEVLNLTGCSDLLFTPDFSGYKDLKFLILEGCSRLVKLDPSIGHLRSLVSLNLRFCSRLNSLPVEMGSMTALKELFIDGTSVREIPISVGNLKKLEILSGFECVPLTHLPRSICYLTALSELSFDGAKITKLPSSLGDLLKLRRLSLRNCRYLEGLPDSIGKLGSSLKELDISRTRISILPTSIGNLESLRVLRMDYSFIRAFPREIGNLTKLKELHASWCRSLKGAIPNDIKRLHHLGSLTLGHSRISSLPTEISTIPHLHTLELIQCNEIEELPKLPPSLVHLRVSSTRMKVMPLLEDLKELEELCLSDGDSMENGPTSKQPMPESNVIDEQSFLISFPKLRKLELSLSQVIKLKFGPTKIPPLERLKMPTFPGSSHKKVLELPKALSVLKLYDSAIEEIEGLEGLEALKRLDISNCRIQNLDGIGQLTSLRSLILSDCNCLSSLDVSKLKSLKVLEIRRCKMICQIEGLDKLTSLVERSISECQALTTM